jgi:uncharacterized membrane protein YqgA involved in biofilm formation
MGESAMNFPLGIIVDSLAIVAGGILGMWILKLIPAAVTEALPIISSVGAFGLAVNSIIKIQSAAAVIFALLLGSIIGIILDLEKTVSMYGKGLAGFVGRITKTQRTVDKDFLDKFSISFILFCAGAVGIYGSIHSSLSGDHSILIAKAVLDFFTAFAFASSLGYSIVLLAVFQFGIMMAIYAVAGTIAPLISTGMFANFSG